jgi:hypothetical protein
MLIGKLLEVLERDIVSLSFLQEIRALTIIINQRNMELAFTIDMFAFLDVFQIFLHT